MNIVDDAVAQAFNSSVHQVNADLHIRTWRAQSKRLQQKHSAADDTKVGSHRCMLEMPAGEETIYNSPEKVSRALDYLSYIFLIVNGESSELSQRKLAVTEYSLRGERRVMGRRLSSIDDAVRISRIISASLNDRLQRQGVDVDADIFILDS